MSFKISRLLSLVLATTAGVTALRADSPFKALRKHRLRCFTEVIKPELSPEEQIKAKKKLDLAIPEVDEHTAHAQVFSLFESTDSSASEIIQGNVWKDLEVVIGEVEITESLHFRVNRTTTIFGNDFLNYRLTHPTDNIEQLRNRQATVKTIISNKRVYNKLKKALKLAKEGENTFLFMYQGGNEFTNKMIAQFYYNCTWPLFKELKKLNSNVTFLQAKTLLERIPSAAMLLWYPIIEWWLHNTLTGFNTLPRNEYGRIENETLEKVYPTFFEFAKNEEENAREIAEHYQKGEYYQFIKKPLAILFGTLKEAAAWGLKSHQPNGNTITLNRILRRHDPRTKVFANIENVTEQDLINAGKNHDYPTWGDTWKYAIDRDKANTEKIEKGWIKERYDWFNNKKYTSKIPGREPKFFERHGNKIGIAAIDAAFLGSVGVYGYVGTKREIAYNNLTNYMHTQLIAVAKVIRAMKMCSDVILQNQTFASGFDYAQDLHVLFDTTSDRVSKKLQRLAQLLLTSTFDGQASYFSLKGRVLAAYSLMQDVKDDLGPALRALAEVDVMVSTAILYKEFEDQRVGYILPEYLDEPNPKVVIKDMWNPFVSAHKVVQNSVTLGGELPQNVILTGPNAGGKSTFLKGICINILLAQTLGIAPAEELIFTPFARINTYMNITDDTAGGNSLFKSEVLRAQGLLNAIKNLDSRDFAFSIMDEMFCGTSPKEGAAASYAVAKNLGTRNNSMLLLATHFPLLTKLEKDSQNFKNYQVRVVRHDNGTFSYPFKLEEGIADQNVAMDILQQQGFDSSILSDAQALLAKKE